MRIAITGATGMIGRKLSAYLMSQGHQITVLTRNNTSQIPQGAVIIWDPALGYLEPKKLEGFDVVINLAGANVGERWTPKRRQEILESRLCSTKLLCQSLTELVSKPKILISASAIGFYGSHSPGVVLDEDSPSGEGFLAEVCRQWENAAKILTPAGIRVVLLRLGVVLSKTGGALARMRQPFQMGLGGVLGSGRQMMSWVALDEIPYIIDFLIRHERISGPVNAVSPHAVSNAEFTRALGAAIHRPTVFPVPDFAIRLMFGEMGQNLLLEGSHVVPRRLQQYGYKFHYANLELALQKAIF